MKGKDGIMVTLKRTRNGDDYYCETRSTQLKNVAQPGKSKEMIKTLPEFYIVDNHDIDREAFSIYAGPLVGPLPEAGELELLRPKPVE